MLILLYYSNKITKRALSYRVADDQVNQCHCHVPRAPCKANLYQTNSDLDRRVVFIFCSLWSSFLLLFYFLGHDVSLRTRGPIGPTALLVTIGSLGHSSLQKTSSIWELSHIKGCEKIKTFSWLSTPLLNIRQRLLGRVFFFTGQLKNEWVHSWL